MEKVLLIFDTVTFEKKKTPDTQKDPFIVLGYLLR